MSTSLILFSDISPTTVPPTLKALAEGDRAQAYSLISLQSKYCFQASNPRAPSGMRMLLGSALSTFNLVPIG